MILNKISLLKYIPTRGILNSSSILINQKSCYATNNPRERKRFYKDVSFNESFIEQQQQNNDAAKAPTTKYEINLDKRKLKTPNGNLVQVNNEMLAALIAHEWKIQDKFIRLNSMHLTTLLNTCIDNPLNITKAQIVNSLKTYIQTDTLLYRENENLDLMKLQDKKWTPYVNWVNEKFPELKLHVKYDLSTNIDSIEQSSGLSSSANDNLERYLYSYDLNSLIAINFISENLKSVILTLALINRKIDTVDEACNLALLETQFQTNRWGNVEWHHTIEEVEIKTRISAALVFVYFNSNFYNTKAKNKN